MLIADSAPDDAPDTASQSKLLDQVGALIKVKHYSIHPHTK
jgi:hypothetical protein